MFGSTEMIIVLVIVLVLFGGSQLPKLAKNLGKAQKEFKDAVDESKAPDAPAATAKTDGAPASQPAESSDQPST
jgi:sec-independent protein translocase protein TatA